METPRIIEAHVQHHNVCYYGGKLEQKYRVVIGLFTQPNVLLGWIKFFNDENDIPDDGFDTTGMLHMNLPFSQFQGLLSSLRRKDRGIFVNFDTTTNRAMLSEVPAQMPPAMISGSDISQRIN